MNCDSVLTLRLRCRQPRRVGYTWLIISGGRCSCGSDHPAWCW